MSTSHSAALGRERGDRPVYDLRSWQGLTDVLRVAKANLSPEEHASFRDLVLQYAQRGGDQELKAEIDAVIARLGAPAERPETKEVAPDPESQPIDVPPSAERPTIRSMRRAAPRFMPRSLMHEEEVVATPSPPEASAPVQEPQPQPTIDVVEETRPEPPAARGEVKMPEAPQSATEAMTGSPRSLEEHKARIIEIKRIVNEQIGNPVALVGAHKERGRAYMQALLTALKATGAGGSGVEAAMRTLEDAYSALLTEQPESLKEPEPAPVPEMSEPALEPAHELHETSVEPAPRDPGPVPGPISASQIGSGSVPPPSTERVPSAAPQRPSPISPTFSATKMQASGAPVEKKIVPVSTTERKASSHDGFSETKYTQKKLGAASVQSLAEKGIDAEQTAVRQSELVSPQITQALHDLLHEWSIFSSSGFFGTGPSGPEHPLYIKLAPLSMGEIITGRYEGADRQINNIIHDYVNAWRHEQGIAYTPSETFEHYLRRVVQRIQKRNRSSQ